MHNFFRVLVAEIFLRESDNLLPQRHGFAPQLLGQTEDLLLDLQDADKGGVFDGLAELDDLVLPYLVDSAEGFAVAAVEFVLDVGLGPVLRAVYFPGRSLEMEVHLEPLSRYCSKRSFSSASLHSLTRALPFSYCKKFLNLSRSCLQVLSLSGNWALNFFSISDHCFALS